MDDAREMTREEAIDILQNTSFFGRTMDDIDTAIKMAIKALEQQPCEDAVSRAEVLNLVRYNAFHVKSQIKAIENLPPVTPQEPCEDTISRQAVLALAKNGVLVSNENYKSVCKAINKIPSVNPQEPKSTEEATKEFKELLESGYKDGVNDVLGKIRAEIEQNAYPIVHGVNNHEKGMTLYGILQIIDKYRESEDK